MMNTTALNNWTSVGQGPVSLRLQISKISWFVKFSTPRKMHILRSMCTKFWVKFQRAPLWNVTQNFVPRDNETDGIIRSICTASTHGVCSCHYCLPLKYRCHIRDPGFTIVVSTDDPALNDARSPANKISTVSLDMFSSKFSGCHHFSLRFGHQLTSLKMADKISRLTISGGTSSGS